LVGHVCRAESTQDHSQAKELEEESWLAKAYGYEQWRVIFARSLLAWRLHIDVNRTEQNSLAGVRGNGYVDDKLQMMR